MKYKSVAYWPKEITGLGNTANKTEDTHDTYEQADAVCQMLKSNGFGGDGKIFPLSTEVVECE